MRDKIRKILNPIDRRTLLKRGGAMLGAAVAAGQVLKPGKALAQSASGRSLTQGTFTLSAVGEAMATRPFSMNTEKGMTDIVNLLRGSDLSYGHLEMNIATDDQLDWAARGSSGGAGYLVADPQVVKDMKWAGIGVMSLAQNHSFDWGVAGLRATIKNCRAAGIAVAGTGDDLEEASAPCYVETDKGRISMISVASGNSTFEWAGYTKGPTPGRPGINPLRLKMIYEVDGPTAAQLKAAGRNLGVLSNAAAARPEFNITPGAISGSNGYSGFTFRESDKFNVTTEGHPADIERNMRSIEEARRMSDFVMVAHHNSVSERTRGEDPCAYQVDFAHKAIDAGADLYLGHGWHTYLGIEIYKGKPIIYGMGSFFWQSSYITNKPADQYESHGFSMDELTTLNPASGDLHPGGSEHWGYAAVNQFVFDKKQLKEIRIYPIEMGYDFSSGKGVIYRTVGAGLGDGHNGYLDGSPRMAYGENGQWILKRLQYLNGLRGSKMDIRGNVGVVQV